MAAGLSLAHELGHFLIEAHRPREGLLMECALGDLFLLSPRDKDRRRRIEGEANRFAAHLLMPRKRIREYIGYKGTSIETIVAMASDMNVSKEAMARAFVDAHHEPVAIVVARHGKLERFYRSEDFPFLPLSKGDPLPSGTLSSDPIEAGQFTEAEKIEADEWFDDRQANRGLALTEQALGQAKGYSLTLLQTELDDEE
ncbi:ImmA/IrrE family metallo-endopeptidase [Qipengyuania aurantiaca]|uniref:ImmA/IrrE family metallo-endopeptidase n=1 Tax=Qipengyuania aurantiaca TaxID=2867233 RepID=A0ABX8ZU63_9SPHN|nr:ImmA/IrrE family metallo-endopeptidase [Qipengyuania aurantiaca]QZD91183.1 ImmA/IrrE family metallo-endopeptidase [Qipengyuania aurantiaca]